LDVMKMPNRRPEQDLIDRFVTWLKITEGTEYICANCKTQTNADVEYRLANGEYWVIEAKSHDSSDKYNTAHKLFGELLKETGRARAEKQVHIGVLIPTEGRDFYAKCFRAIARDKFIAFGELIPVATVFLCDQNGKVTESKWSALHD
jgi:hypothetical protein